jgi:hypothetical protein
MDAPDFLDWDHNNRCFSGLMHEWQNVSKEIGYPIRAWIVEANAAQRFLLQYDHVKRWQRLAGVNIVPHTTAKNKSDPNFGVQTIAPHYQYGRVRLPGAPNARLTALKLVDEVTRYPEGGSDDCVMAQWFLEWNLPRLFRPANTQPTLLRRPAWLRRDANLREIVRT